MKKFVITSYYTLIIFVVAFQILSTIFQGSLLVHQSYKVAQLHNSQEELLQKKEALESTIRANTSLSSIAQSSAVESFVPISKSLSVVDTQSRVADSSL